MKAGSSISNDLDHAYQGHRRSSTTPRPGGGSRLHRSMAKARSRRASGSMGSAQGPIWTRSFRHRSMPRRLPSMDRAATMKRPGSPTRWLPATSFWPARMHPT
jgi:hypothetical protein